jgi:hypothetical protein
MRTIGVREFRDQATSLLASVGELLRTSGRGRLADARLELLLPEQMWDETRIELPDASPRSSADAAGREHRRRAGRGQPGGRRGEPRRAR